MDIEKLKAIAAAATGGDWVVDGEVVNEHGNLLQIYVGQAGAGRVGAVFANCTVADKTCRANAEFMAEARPAVALELIAEIERLAYALGDKALCSAYAERQALKAEVERQEGAILNLVDRCGQLQAERDHARAEVERTARNRDMWKGQVERQAAALSDQRGLLQRGHEAHRKTWCELEQVKRMDPRQWTDRQLLDFLGTALRNVDLVGVVHLSEIRQGFEVVMGRAALPEPIPASAAKQHCGHIRMPDRKSIAGLRDLEVKRAAMAYNEALEDVELLNKQAAPAEQPQ